VVFGAVAQPAASTTIPASAIDVVFIGSSSHFVAQLHHSSHSSAPDERACDEPLKSGHESVLPAAPAAGT
jgi:hypothetical protein